MSQNYDNWERVVEAVLRREELRQVALYSSREPSFSSISSSFITEPATPIHDDQNIQLGTSSNTVNETDWERLLPSDYEDIIARSVNPVAYATKKDLYLSLCDSPILLDGGNKSFQLDKTTGKKCYMIGARELEIFMADDPQALEWTSHKDSRFSSMVELFLVPWVDIRGRIETRMLSPKTRYAAYLVFKLGNFRDFESAQGIIKYVKYDEDDEAEERAATLHLQPVKSKNGKIAVRRSDGWMEVQLGMFYNDLGEDGPVEARMLGMKTYITSGFIVEGIEFRPTTNAEIGRNRRKGIFSNLRIFG
ncbi:F-box protein PP2-B10 [Abeliophyllum distichum]|uniref:F-box protein PP2-B10 n=1 Tax=Abeliophyllum distichum TaxID=126358 RepID=A0ABD1Q007_9LAMI